MRTYKIILSIFALALACATAYISFMYVYVDHMFTPVMLLATPSSQAPHQEWKAPIVPFIHKVNTPARARKKDKKYLGFEVDIFGAEGQILAAHDTQEATQHTLLADIFAAVENPAQKVWWLDIKGELTNSQLDEIVALASSYQIPAEHLLFESSAGPTAKRIVQKNLGLLLQLPDNFDKDNGSAKTRAQLNAAALALWNEYQPLAVSASFGKYAYLQAYFPNMPKAIYYSATRRPSIKKSLMRRHMEHDSSIKIFMTDEYSWINL